MEVFLRYNAFQVTILVSLALSVSTSNELEIYESLQYNLGTSCLFSQLTKYPRDCAEVKTNSFERCSSGVFMIKPDGFDEPFEAFCENNVDGDGWTLIQRRTDGFINFNRSWSDYKEGFGYFRSEFWIGNQKLSYLTNQKKYQLRIDLENSGGSSFFFTYEVFRISDEFSNFRLVSLGKHAGTEEGSFIETCPTNQVFKSCSCQTSCANPAVCDHTCSSHEDDESCTCPDGFFIKGYACVPPEECTCYVTGRGVIPDGGSYVNNNCSERCSCEAGTISCNSSFRCDSTNAVCVQIKNITECHCKGGFHGDGQSCTFSEFTDCYDAYTSGATEDGVYYIKPAGWPGSEFEVYCNMSNGGGWTVFQRREDGSIEFYCNWTSYKNGFPDTASGELWLGNEKLYYLTNQKSYKMRIDLVNRDGVSYNLNYDAFRISNEANKYTLETLGSFTGNTDYDYMGYHRGQQFSTYDDDNDDSSKNCASAFHGAWWYGDCYAANLNGDYDSNNDSGISLYIRGSGPSTYDISFTEMKLRPVVV